MPVLSITIADMRRHDACDLPKRIAALEAHLGRPVAEDEAVLLQVWAQVTPSTADLVWALRVRPEGWPIAVEVALRAAERTLVHVRPADRPVCEAAIAAARGYLRGEVSREYLRAAVDAAYAAAYTDAAAYAAVCAAYAAADASYVAYAADATHAVYAAAYAANAAALSAVPCYADTDAADERAHQRADLLELL